MKMNHERIKTKKYKFFSLLSAALTKTGGCMNTGYLCKVTTVTVDGKLPPKDAGVRLTDKKRFGYWDMSAMDAIRRYAKETATTGVPIDVNVNRTSESSDSPMWERIPSFMTLTILPLYGMANTTYAIELRYPEGKATLEVAIKGHGLVSFFPTGLLPIPGRFHERTWTAGGEAFMGGDCGARSFTEKAIEKATYDWLKEGVN